MNNPLNTIDPMGTFKMLGADIGENVASVLDDMGINSSVWATIPGYGIAETPRNFKLFDLVH